jgi:hypothetical protein
MNCPLCNAPLATEEARRDHWRSCRAKPSGQARQRVRDGENKIRREQNAVPRKSQRD